VTPRLVIADELSFGLAPLIVDDVYGHLLRVRELGVSLIIIEQFIARALAMADQVLLLRRGTAAWAGPAAQTTAGDLLARYLGPGTGHHPAEAGTLAGGPGKPPAS
jgi:branched-chain amino acid transport system ATP-binding protein